MFVMDMDNVHNVLIPVRVACSVCVSGSASCALEGWDLEVCTSLYPWRFMFDRIFLQVLGRQARLLDSGDRAGLFVSFPEGMVSCNPGQALVFEPRIFFWAMWLMKCGCSCMGRRVPPWRRAVPAVDEADVQCVHVSGRQACSVVSPGRLLMRWRVGILRFARPCVRGGFCDASGAEASVLSGR